MFLGALQIIVNMVQQIDISTKVNSISPDFIYNRADIFCKNYILLNVRHGSNNYMLEVRLHGNHAELGIWMMKVTGKEFDEISKFIFTRYKEIEYISFYYAISDRVFTKGSHFHVVLPKSYEELEMRISSKSRYNMRRMRKQAIAEYGSIELEEFENENIPSDIISAYFEMKKKTHNVSYLMTSDDYLARYHVSNAYVLYLGEKIAAILLTCEQCPIVYLENLTYDMEFSNYSPGMIAYDMVLERLINKGKESIYLGGGDYSYKKKYNSVETAVTDGKIYRSLAITIKYKVIDYYNKHLFWKIRSLKCSLFTYLL